MHIIDTHNHSLPGIDDGAKNLGMALRMLKVAEAAGTQEVVLTPHHLNGAFTNESEFIQSQVAQLRAAASDIDITLHVGSEVHITPETVEHLTEQKALTYCGHGKAALIELPKHDIPNGVDIILSELLTFGITPIIAHPERNTLLRADHGRLKEWVSMGCTAQVTGQSCTGEFGIKLQRCTLNMISSGLIHLAASDAHRPTGRSPSLRRTADILTELFGDEVCHTLLAENPARLISGRNLLPCKLPTSNRALATLLRRPTENLTGRWLKGKLLKR